MADKQAVVGVEINARRQQIEVLARSRGQSRHTHFPNLSQTPPDLRGEALALIRGAILNSGYSSLAELEAALTSAPVLPEEEKAEGEA